MRRLKGVMAVVPTPLTTSEDADLDSIERLIEFLAGHGTSLFALGSAGEGMNLTFKTRVAAARKMAEVNNGRVPLLVGGGGFSVRDCLEFINAVADCRIDGIHIIPYDKKVSGGAVESVQRDRGSFTVADLAVSEHYAHQRHSDRGRQIPQSPPQHPRRQTCRFRPACEPGLHGAGFPRLPGVRFG